MVLDQLIRIDAGFGPLTGRDFELYLTQVRDSSEGEESRSRLAIDNGICSVVESKKNTPRRSIRMPDKH